MVRHSLLLLALLELSGCSPRKPLPVSKDLGPAVQVIDVAGKPAVGVPGALTPSPLPETEPNDDREHAQRLDPQKVLRGSLLPPTTSGAGKGDDDFFVWPAQPTAQTLRIDGSGAPDLSLELLTESGQSLGVLDDRGAGEGERLWGLSLRAGQPLFIRVRGRLKAEAAHEPILGAYQLAVSATAASPDSEAEPNDTLAQATPILGSDASGALSTRRDEDFFVLTLPATPGRRPPSTTPGEGLREAAILRIELTSPAVQSAIRVFVEPAASADSDGGAPSLRAVLEVSASKGREDLRIRNLPIPAGSGRVFVAVRGTGFARPPGESRYHVRLLLESPLEGAESEPNDLCQSQATVLGLSSGSADVAGFLWPGDLDCFHITAPSGQPTTYQAKLILPGGDCSASLEIVRDGGKPEDRKTRTAKSDTAKVSDGKPAEVSLTTTGDFFLRVSSRERRTCFESPYRLSVTTDGTTDGAKP